MSLRDAVKLKMGQADEAAALLDKTADYDSTKVMGFFIKALGPGGKTYDMQINLGEPAFNALLTGFTNMLTKRRTDAQAILTAMGVQ